MHFLYPKPKYYLSYYSIIIVNDSISMVLLGIIENCCVT